MEKRKSGGREEEATGNKKTAERCCALLKYHCPFYIAILLLLMANRSDNMSTIAISLSGAHSLTLYSNMTQAARITSIKRRTCICTRDSCL